MSIEIAYIQTKHIESFHVCLDTVAREKLFLALFKAPPLDHLRGFMAANITNDYAQFVALEGAQVVGWCDILPDRRNSLSRIT